ncbi:MAG: hypothetical protein P8X51_14385, partial [Maritimibacter sp.]
KNKKIHHINTDSDSVKPICAGTGLQSVRVFPTDTPDRITAKIILPMPVPQIAERQGLMAHYVEHLAWLNSVGNKDRDADRESNAWTTPLAVGYWLTGAPEDLPEILQTLTAVFDPIGLPREFAEQERDILQREYDFRLRENTAARASIALDGVLYEGDIRANSPAGTPEEIAALSYDEALDFHAATHRAERATLIVSGDISERAVYRALHELDLPDLPDDPAPSGNLAFSMAGPEDNLLRFADPDTPTWLIWRRVAEIDPGASYDLLEAQGALLSNILTTSLPGGLAGPLRYDAQIAQSFSVDIWPLDDNHIGLQFVAAPDQGVTLAGVQEAFAAALVATADAGIPSKTYDRVQKRFDGYWPDWSNAPDTEQWMASYVEDRVSQQRVALGRRDLQDLNTQFSLAAENRLLTALAGGGRDAIAFIGNEDQFE